MAAPAKSDTATFTPTTRQKWLPPALAAVLLIAEAVSQVRHRHNPDPGISHQLAMFDLYFWSTVTPLYALLIAGSFLPHRIELGETALILRRPYRRRRVIHWHNIQAVRIDERGSRCRVAVYGDDPDGRRTLLPVPYSGFMVKDPNLGVKFHILGQAWLARRGDDWEPLPPPHPGWLGATTK